MTRWLKASENYKSRPKVKGKGQVSLKLYFMMKIKNKGNFICGHVCISQGQLYGHCNIKQPERVDLEKILSLLRVKTLLTHYLVRLTGHYSIITIVALQRLRMILNIPYTVQYSINSASMLHMCDCICYTVYHIIHSVLLLIKARNATFFFWTLQTCIASRFGILKMQASACSPV